MKKIIIIALASIALIGVNSFYDQASAGGHHGHHGHHGRVSVGIGVGMGWWPYWGSYYYPYSPHYYPYYPYYPYYAAPHVVIQREPDTYIQQDDQSDEPEGYWYFCREPEGYYPYVKKCPKGWQRVLPIPDQENEGEE